MGTQELIAVAALLVLASVVSVLIWKAATRARPRQPAPTSTITPTTWLAGPDRGVPRQLREGETVRESGIAFTFSENLPRLIRSTSSDSGRFQWRWMAIGQVIENTSQALSYHAMLLMGDDGSRFLSVVLPLAGSRHLYQSVDIRTVEIQLHAKRGLLGRTRVKGLLLIVSDELGFAARRVDEFVPGSPERPRSKREAEFCQHYGVDLIGAN